jgi:hypothetical protein
MIDAIDSAIPENVSQGGLIRGYQAGLNAVVARYEQAPPPAMFRIISWGGGLMAVGPAPAAAGRRATAGLKARVAQDLGRA